MIVKYKADIGRSHWSGPDTEIRKVEVERETDHYVWIGDRRELKDGVFWNSFQEAKDALRKAAIHQVTSKSASLRRAIEVSEKIRTLTE